MVVDRLNPLHDHRTFLALSIIVPEDNLCCELMEFVKHKGPACITPIVCNI